MPIPICEFRNPRNGVGCESNAELQIENTGRSVGSFTGVICQFHRNLLASDAEAIQVIIAGRLADAGITGKPTAEQALKARHMKPGEDYEAIEVKYWYNTGGGSVHTLEKCPQLVSVAGAPWGIADVKRNNMREHECQGYIDALARGDAVLPVPPLRGHRNPKKSRRQRRNLSSHNGRQN